MQRTCTGAWPYAYLADVLEHRSDDSCAQHPMNSTSLTTPTPLTTVVTGGVQLGLIAASPAGDWAAAPSSQSYFFVFLFIEKALFSQLEDVSVPLRLRVDYISIFSFRAHCTGWCSGCSRCKTMHVCNPNASSPSTRCHDTQGLFMPVPVTLTRRGNCIILKGGAF